MTAPSLREAATMAKDAIESGNTLKLTRAVLTLHAAIAAHDSEVARVTEVMDAFKDAPLVQAQGRMGGESPLPDAEPVRWEISYMDVNGLRRERVFWHNAIGDYRDIDPGATSTPLYAAPQPAPVERKPQDGWISVKDRLPGAIDMCDWLFPSNLKSEQWVLCGECIVSATLPRNATHWRKAQALPTFSLQGAAC